MACNLLMEHSESVRKGGTRWTYHIATDLQEHGHGELRFELIRTSNVDQRRSGTNMVAPLSNRGPIVTGDGLKPNLAWHLQCRGNQYLKDPNHDHGG